MTMMSTDLDLTILEKMDFAPVCEYVGNNRVECGQAASWYFIALLPLECGCIMVDRFFCSHCKFIREHWPLLTCIYCGVEKMDNDPSTYRFEPISGRSS